MKTPHCVEDVDYLTIMSTQLQASWSLRTDKVNLVTPPCSFIISPSDTCAQTDSETALLHLAFKYALLKPYGELRDF